MENLTENNVIEQQNGYDSDGAPIGFDDTPPSEEEPFPFDCDETDFDVVAAYKGVQNEVKALESEIKSLKDDRISKAMPDEEVSRAAADKRVKDLVIAEYLRGLKSVSPVMGESGKPIASPVYSPKTLKEAKRLVDSMLE